MFREESFNWLKKDKKSNVEVGEEKFIDEGEIDNKENAINESELNNNPHPLARSKAELHPYEHTDKPVSFDKTDIISESAGTRNPEEELMVKEETAKQDPYAEYNAQGDTRPPQRESTWVDDLIDNAYWDRIRNMGHDNKKVETADHLKEDNEGENYSTSKQIRVDKKIEILEDRTDKREFSFLRAPTRGFNTKYPNKDKPDGLKIIEKKGNVRNFWDKITGKE